MVTGTASAIKQEILQLIDLQIENLKQKSSLDSPHLSDYRARSERTRKLYEELDRLSYRPRTNTVSLTKLVSVDAGWSATAARLTSAWAPKAIGTSPTAIPGAAAPKPSAKTVMAPYVIVGERAAEILRRRHNLEVHDLRRKEELA